MKPKTSENIENQPKEPEGNAIHWEHAKDEMTDEEMFENDLIVEQKISWSDTPG